MNNMSKIIKAYNKVVTKKIHDQRPKCNCRKKAECLKERNCLVKYVVYKCDVTRTSPKKLVLADGKWESCIYNHKLSIKTQEMFQ